MNKYLLLGLSLVFGYLTVSNLDASWRDGYSYYEVATASASLQGPLRIQKVYASTGSTTGIWAQIISTNVVSSASYSQFASADKKSPAMVLSTASSNFTTYRGLHELIDYGPDGLAIDTTAFFILSTAASGQANRLGIFYRK